MKNNVLIIVLDAARYDHLSTYGYGRETSPNITSLSKDGIAFENAFAAAPWTPPSHASMFTGEYPSKHGYLNGGMDLSSEKTLAESFSSHGYNTFAIAQNGQIANHTDIKRGFDQMLSLHRLPFLPNSLSEAKTYYIDTFPGSLRMLANAQKSDRHMVEYIEAGVMKRFISRNIASSAPFFGFMNIGSTHSVYAPPEPFKSKFAATNKNKVDDGLVKQLADKGGYRYMAGEVEPTEEDWDAVKDLYDGELAFADSIVGEIIGHLKRNNIYEDTTIVVTSDHGEHFGEYGRAYHQFSLFDELIHVPLIIKPTTESLKKTNQSQLISHVDLMPTLLTECGIDPPLTDGIDIFGGGKRDKIAAEYGKPQAPHRALRNNTQSNLSKEVVAELIQPLQCVRTLNRKLIIKGNGEEIFSVGSPGDEEIITGDEIPDSDIEQLRQYIDETLGDIGTADTTNHQSQKVKENLQDLGYL